MTKLKKPVPLSVKFPPSPPCDCPVCRAYCARPGWWTVEQAAHAVAAGYGTKMILELSPDRSFGVLSPAFRGCEQSVALQRYAANGCNFLRLGLCELHGTGHEPLECLYCHHLRKGMGQTCHAALEEDWRTPAGQQLAAAWAARYLRIPVRAGFGDFALR